MADNEQAYCIALQNDDGNAFETLFLKHFPGLVAFVEAFAPGVRQEAEDVVSDVFAHLWRSRKQLIVHGSIKAYLYTATRNKALDYAKKRRIKTLPLNEDAGAYLFAHMQTPERELLSKEMDAHLSRLIGQLSPQARIIFRMNRDEGLSYAEIADILSISVNTVKTHVYRALKFLKEASAAFTQ
ncbi:MAG TPA: RNA polymerase sigma-70 factor [Dinghuibacter sp.]|uniref:RNA polymerase sigma-70 factor n=1 Tax=Dinghuibacter sp. TaxID=2024697 RepID=UPI002C886E88|nr:RNA polymerase sigma-70 factor [Dinghuibacter sp.]HTJ12351.1 RNA polymerase sigma-70 factor [Dinghuibacter sp.]